jgi:hypothetical protein
MITLKVFIIFFFYVTFLSAQTIFFEEPFEDINFSGRGWYDNTNLILSETEHTENGLRSAEFHFDQGAQIPSSGESIRKKFIDTESLYVSFFIKYSTNWEGSNRSYHPHEFYILTNIDNDFTGPAYTYLTVYIEQNEGQPRIQLQDGRNIDTANINVDLTGVTENRAVAGCNGDGDGHGSGNCYQLGGTGVYRNEKIFPVGITTFSDQAGPYYKADWHQVEVYIHLNDIEANVGIANGQIKYWFDGNLLLEYNDILFRTGSHPSMRMNQFLIGPYFGNGSPVAQTFWLDDLILASNRINSVIPDGPPQAPQNVQIEE